MTDGFTGFGLAEPILRALTARGHSVPTPIQAQSIPPLLQGRDLLGIAQTGTGKTAAFVLPIIHRLNANQMRPGRPRALVLAPTRELAIQIGDEMKAYAKFLNLRHMLVFGGVSEGPQVTALSRGVDILVATPGRLLDLIGQRKADLSGVEVLVLDEADRMLDMGFVRDVRKILAAIPSRRQSMLFSATMPEEIARLAEGMLRDPIRVEVARRSTPIERIDQAVYHLIASEKTGKLASLLSNPDLSKVIVFTRTKHRANRVSDALAKHGIGSQAIHGNKSQNARQKALAAFRNGEARVLVATDIAARGIDVEGVSHVINYELPNEPESYVHRIGRTARAGASGAAISFCDPEERAYLRDIEKLTGVRLAVLGSSPGAELAPDAKPAPRGAGGGGQNRGGGQSPSRNAQAKPANTTGEPRRRTRRRRKAA